MLWLEKLRQSTTEQKLRFIWTVVAITVIILLIVWGFTSNISRIKNSDTSAFSAISKSFHDFGTGIKSK